MFDRMYFHKSAKIDSKKRIFLPSDSNVDEGTEILIAKMPKYYELFLLERINALVEEMQKKFYKVSDEERERIIKDLNYIFSVAVKTSKTDSQRRISMPQNLEANSDAILQGRGDSIAVFPTEEAFNDYIKSIEPSNILR